MLHSVAHKVVLASDYFLYRSVTWLCPRHKSRTRNTLLKTVVFLICKSGCASFTNVTAHCTQQTHTLIKSLLRLLQLTNFLYRSQLALEFSGKATKLYQKHYGDDHASTQRCLDLFTSVYAQVGKEEYTDKLTQYETERAGQPVESGRCSCELTLLLGRP